MSGKFKGPNPNFWIERVLVKSKAFGMLTGAAPRVLLVFFTKREMKEVGKPGHKDWVVGNNGELTFRYREAFKEYGIKAGRFKRALSELVKCGFLDIENPKAQLNKESTLFALSQRWRRYGEPDYELKSMDKGWRWPKRDRKDSGGKGDLCAPETAPVPDGENGVSGHCQVAKTRPDDSGRLLSVSACGDGI